MVAMRNGCYETDPESSDAVAAQCTEKPVCGALFIYYFYHLFINQDDVQAIKTKLQYSCFKKPSPVYAKLPIAYKPTRFFQHVLSKSCS